MPSEGHRPKRASECPKQKAPLSAGLNLGESECKAETLADSPEPLKPLLLGSNLLGQDGRRKVKQPMASHKGSFPSGLMSACGTKRTCRRGGPMSACRRGSGSLAILVGISRIDKGERVAGCVPDDVAARNALGGPGRREAAGHWSDSPSLLQTATLNAGNVLHGRRL
jgi:hypothetical protein